MSRLVKIMSAKPYTVRKYLADLWKHRSLIVTLARRDIRLQYSQTLLGIVWVIIKPLIALAIYTVFFYFILDIKTGDIPYPIFILPGIMAWFHFTQIINEAGTSLSNNQELIRKIAFPKMVLPLSKTLSSLVDVALILVLLVITMACFGYMPTWRIVFFPFFLILNIITGLGIALWLAALTFKYRDFHHLIPFLVSFGIWVTPVFYPQTILPPNLAPFLYANPLAAIIAGYRWALLGTEVPDWQYCLSFIPVIVIFIGGIFYSTKVEDEIVDYI